VRHNDVSNILSTASDRFGPIHRRKPNRDVDARPWCRGFYAAMQLRMSAWAPLLNTDDINHGLLLLSSCMASTIRDVCCSEASPRKAYTDIPTVVEAVRRYWMPIRYSRDACLPRREASHRSQSSRNGPARPASPITHTRPSP
jgi:uncharacterized protein